MYNYYACVFILLHRKELSISLGARIPVAVGNLLAAAVGGSGCSSSSAGFSLEQTLLRGFDGKTGTRR